MNSLYDTIEQRKQFEVVTMGKQEFNLLQVIESVNAIIWEYDIAKDSWEYVSPQTKTILGYEPEEWTNLEFWEKNVHEEDRNWAKDYCLRATSEGRDHVFEYRFMKKMVILFGLEMK